MGDFNGDGKTDFIRVNPEYMHTFISLGREGNMFAFKAGTFMYPTTWNFHPGVGKKSEWSTITGDFNADGKTDWAKVGATHMKVFLSQETVDPFETGDSAGVKDVFETSTQYYTVLGANFGNDMDVWGIATGNWQGLEGDAAVPHVKITTDTNLNAATGFSGGNALVQKSEEELQA